jgi:DNA-binding CsgD family transcriptional regulator
VPAAIRYADEGCALTEQTGQATVGAYALALRALADAIAGDVEAGRECAERALAVAARTNGRPAEHFARAALGLLEQSVGRPAEVVRALGPLVDFLRAEQITEPGTARVLPDQVEALIALGEPAAAEELLGWFEANARRLDRRSALAAAARCRGLLAGARGDVETAVAELQGALALHEGVPIPLELARTRLAYGSALRRSRQKAAAREALEAAYDGFDALGAHVWAARAEAELGRVGGRPPSSGELTPTERRVAALVAQGLQTKQVAGRLFVSPKTVEGHLTRIYGKLGVGSRTELARRLDPGDD